MPADATSFLGQFPPQRILQMRNFQKGPPSNSKLTTYLKSLWKGASTQFHLKTLGEQEHSENRDFTANVGRRRL